VPNAVTIRLDGGTITIGKSFLRNKARIQVVAGDVVLDLHADAAQLGELNDAGIARRGALRRSTT
jgi:hypothetical protein